MSLITIKNDRMTVVISTKGAEMQSIRDANGIERLWQGDPAFWAGRAPILFPVAGGMKDDGYTLDGVAYTMPKHGLVRKEEWQLESAAEDTATFAISLSKEGSFPFRYTLRATYTLAGDSIKITNTVTNEDERELVYSIGSHEAYATPEGIESYYVQSDTEECWKSHTLIGNLITHETETICENTRDFALKYEYFAVDALVFTDLKTRALTLRTPLHDRAIRVEYPDCDVLMLWTKPGAGYICIEPWRNGPDYVDAPADIRKKPGFVAVPAGETSVTTHTLTLL